MKIILTNILLLISAICVAQSKPGSQKMADEIKKNISFARNYTYREQPDYDIDGLCLITGKKTANLMTGNNFSTAYYEKLGLSLSSQSNDKQAIKIFNFS